MDQERHEVYERIPWEVLEKPRPDYNWLVIALAGAVAVGALAYSFVRSQPLPPASTAVVPVTAAAQPPAPESAATDVPFAISEADLFAVDAERTIDEVSAHAEWFAVEFIAYDGSEESKEILEALLPEGLPLPEAPEGTQVFVDWVRASSVTEVRDMGFRVEVMVRSLASSSEGGFIRQRPITLVLEIVMTEVGVPMVTRPPTILEVVLPVSAPLSLGTLPDGVPVDPSLGQVLGAHQDEQGGWWVVAMTTGLDGVTRPQAVALP